MNRVGARFLSTSVLVTALIACGKEEDPVVTPPTPVNDDIELVGEWHSAFGGIDTITKTKWGTSTIISADNTKNVVILQSPADDPFTANKFAKGVWTEPTGGHFFFCTVDFGQNTKEEAANTLMVADPTDPSSSGCGGNFPWTGYEPKLEISGAFSSNFQTMETIDSDTWFTMGAGYDLTVDVVSYDNAANVMYTQNPDTDAFNPSKFNKVVWTEPVAGVFHHCTTDYGLDTLEQARTSTQTANSTSPDTGGCGTFPWTKLSPR